MMRLSEPSAAETPSAPPTRSGDTSFETRLETRVLETPDRRPNGMSMSVNVIVVEQKKANK